MFFIQRSIVKIRLSAQIKKWRIASVHERCERERMKINDPKNKKCFLINICIFKPSQGPAMEGKAVK